MVNADETAVGTPDDPGADGNDGDPPARWEGPTETRNGDEAEAMRTSVGKLPGAAREWIVNTVQVLMREYCSRGGKRIYGDKSLDSVYHLALVRELFPEVRMVLVFRHVMDTIASGIEASPWGFQAYGYAPYVQASPGNSVAALASYWVDHVDRAVAWEKKHPELCHRLRYEDLVQRPEEAIAEVQRFLGVAEDMSVLQAAFDRPAPRGPGDYKVEHTTAVHAASIGHGKRVPVTLLPPALLKAVNEKLEVLGYARLDGAWNAAERPIDAGGEGLWADRLGELMSAVGIAPGDAHTGSFAVVAEDHRALRWVVDPVRGRVERGDGEVEGVLTGTAEDLVLMLTQGENLGVLLRSVRGGQLVRFGVRDGARWWRWDREHGSTSGGDSPSGRTSMVPPLLDPALLQPARLIGAFRFEAVGEGMRLGRAVLLAHAVLRAGASEERPAHEFEFEFDSEHGTMLRRAAFAAGRCVQVTEALEARFEAPLEPELFVFAPPGEGADIDANPHETHFA